MRVKAGDRLKCNWCGSFMRLVGNMWEWDRDESANVTDAATSTTPEVTGHE